MTEYDLLDRLKGYLDGELEATSQNMLRGVYTDHVSYREAVARAAAWDQTLEYLEKVEKEFLEQ